MYVCMTLVCVGNFFQFYSDVIDIQHCVRLRYRAGKYFLLPQKEFLNFTYISTLTFTLKSAIEDSRVGAAPSPGTSPGGCVQGSLPPPVLFAPTAACPTRHILLPSLMHPQHPDLGVSCASLTSFCLSLPTPRCEGPGQTAGRHHTGRASPYKPEWRHVETQWVQVQFQERGHADIWTNEYTVEQLWGPPGLQGTDTAGEYASLEF